MIIPNVNTAFPNCVSSNVLVVIMIAIASMMSKKNSIFSAVVYLFNSFSNWFMLFRGIEEL